MKPLLETKVVRGNGSDPDKTLKEWESAKDQDTLAGLQGFTRRQEERRRRIQGKPAQVTEFKPRRVP